MYTVYTPYLLPFPTNGHKQKPTITPLHYYLRSQYTLFAIIFFFLLSIPSCNNNTIQNYHCQLLRHYRPDQIEQQLTFYSTVFQQTVDFVLMDFDKSNGVGTNSNCFCLNYHSFPHLHLLPTYSRGTGDNKMLSLQIFLEFSFFLHIYGTVQVQLIPQSRLFYKKLFTQLLDVRRESIYPSLCAID